MLGLAAAVHAIRTVPTHAGVPLTTVVLMAPCTLGTTSRRRRVAGARGTEAALLKSAPSIREVSAE